MFCFNCRNQINDNSRFCNACGAQQPQQQQYQQPPQPQPQQYAPQPPQYQPQQYAPQPPQYAPQPPPQWQPSVQMPAKKKILHLDVKGTVSVGFMTFFAWLIALIAPVVGLYMVLKGLIEEISHLITNFRISVWDIILGIIGGDFLTESLTYNNAGSSTVLNRLQDITLVVHNGSTAYFYGVLLIFLIFIPLIIMLVMLRKNITAGRVLLIINTVLCCIGSTICCLFIQRLSDAIGVLPPPYNNTAFIIMLCACVTTILWIMGTIIYFVLVGKSKKLFDNM